MWKREFQGRNFSFSSDRKHQVLADAHGHALLGRSQSGRMIGHDSYFIAETDDFIALGVADGVTEWVNHGINPAIFSVSLMENCRRSALRGVSSPLSILQDGYTTVQAVHPRIIGSSTACLAVIQNTTLTTANLGDSGFLVIRGSTVAHKSSSQLHFPQCPYQLSILPSSSKGNHAHDSPKMADFATFQLQPRDVIILGTDGLFENLDHKQIIDNQTFMKIQCNSCLTMN
jgi:protein phosphatase PTC7